MVSVFPFNHSPLKILIQQEISHEVAKLDDEVFPSPKAKETCHEINSIVVTQSLNSLSTSCITWYHHKREEKKIYKTLIEINLMMDEKEKSVSDDLVSKLNSIHFNE